MEPGWKAFDGSGVPIGSLLAACRLENGYQVLEVGFGDGLIEAQAYAPIGVIAKVDLTGVGGLSEGVVLTF
jgi:hypothetical protein